MGFHYILNPPLMIRMITLILPLCCLFNPERHELARGIYIIREVYIAMFVIRIIQLTIAFNHCIIHASLI